MLHAARLFVFCRSAELSQEGEKSHSRVADHQRTKGPHESQGLAANMNVRAERILRRTQHVCLAHQPTLESILL